MELIVGVDLICSKKWTSLFRYSTPQGFILNYTFLVFNFYNIYSWLHFPFHEKEYPCILFANSIDSGLIVMLPLFTTSHFLLIHSESIWWKGRLYRRKENSIFVLYWKYLSKHYKGAIRPLCGVNGHAMVYYSQESALSANCFNHVTNRHYGLGAIFLRQPITS